MDGSVHHGYMLADAAPKFRGKQEEVLFNHPKFILPATALEGIVIT